MDLRDVDDVADGGPRPHRRPRRGRVIDAVGMEAHGSPLVEAAPQARGRCCPTRCAQKLMITAGIDRLAALRTAIDGVRRGGTISLIGVYGGMADPLPMMTLFDKQVQLRMGQANVKRWVDDILPLLDRTTTRSASTTSPPTACRWTTPRRLRGLPGQEGRRGQGRPQARDAGRRPG